MEVENQCSFQQLCVVDGLLVDNRGLCLFHFHLDVFVRVYEKKNLFGLMAAMP